MDDNIPPESRKAVREYRLQNERQRIFRRIGGAISVVLWFFTLVAFLSGRNAAVINIGVLGLMVTLFLIIADRKLY